MKHIIWHDEEADVSQLGGKAAALSFLEQHGFAVPQWFVVSPQAFHGSVPDVQDRVLNNRDLCHIKPQITDELQRELDLALARLCPDGERVAVRSSALDEDGAQHSFAGQFESFLHVHSKDVAAQVLDVWYSAFSERVLNYRRKHGLHSAPQPPAVLVQRMINADVAGVAFSADPVTGRRGIAVVSSLFGLGSALVSGECDADVYHIGRDEKIVQRRIAHKNQMRQLDVSGEVRTLSVSNERARQPALSDEQAIVVAQLARGAARCFGSPQDIEWATENGELWLLQSRAITSLQAMADPDGALNIWDNSNIVESYSGVTLPLTFSFARRAYAEVYRQFCRLMSVREEQIARHDNTFNHMLGLARGRVYYNLLNWYRLLALLPGFTFNRRFMEQMMGVKEEMPAGLLPGKNASSRYERTRDALHLSFAIIVLVRSYRGLPRDSQQFYKRLEESLNLAACPLHEMRADELASHYHELERRLLRHWDTPLVNDFFTMVFCGVLRRLTEKWCADADGHLYNDLLRSIDGVVSAELAQHMNEIASSIREDKELIEFLCCASLPEIRRQMRKRPAFQQTADEYLTKFGDRCLQELKLESPTLHDEPLSLLRAIGSLARRKERATTTFQNSSEKEQFKIAQARTQTLLEPSRIKRGVLQWILRHARARIRDRENLRFERTRLFGRVRRIFLEIGKRFRDVDVLDDARDVFYLEVDEVLGYIEGVTTTTDLKGLVALRRAEYALYAQGDAPDARFATNGIVHHVNTFRAATVMGSNDTEQTGNSEERKGLGCCPGVVRGTARLIHEPRDASLSSGDILIAESTDPGWITLFAAAAGIITQRGSLLSHSAIVARELNIPAVVALDNVMQWLNDGDYIELDGGRGIVRRIQSELLNNNGNAD